MVSERERPGQRCLQISFRELHLPAATKEERHDRVVCFRVAGQMSAGLDSQGFRRDYGL
jgi:hypothetical protein